MKTFFEIRHTSTHNGKYGFCPDDYNVETETKVVGRCGTYEAARARMLELLEEYHLENKHFFWEDGERGESWSNDLTIEEVAEEPVITTNNK